MLRSIRYGEADRILHLYTAERGRVGAVAKGVRRREVALRRPARAVLPRRAWCCTRAAASSARSPGARPCTPTPRCASAARRSSAPSQACEAVLRLLDSHEPNPPAYNLLCHELPLLDADPAAADARPGARLPAQAAAGRRLRARAGRLRGLRRARAPRRASRPAPAASSARAARRAPSRSTRRRTGSWSRRWAGRSPRRRRRPSARWPGRPRDRRDAGAPRPRAAAARRGLS